MDNNHASWPADGIHNINLCELFQAVFKLQFHGSRCGMTFSSTERLAAEESRENKVLFGSRLGTYQYLDMHMVIGVALSVFDNHVRPYFEDGKAIDQPRGH